ncbi:MAG: flagellar export protein FliJ [Spirochaetales bacterium]|jgi:flagellar FliJ protein|nr:flagellar export protein FliJ [Spirochaetales bacterium]
MNRYKFRLERLLQLRRHKERLREMELAEISGRCVRLENHIRDLQNEKDEYAGFSAEGVPYCASDILAREAFRGRLDLEMEETGRRLKKAVRERETASRSYLEAARDRKVLDKLKERKAEEYYEDQRRREGKIMDETAMFRSISAGREGGE